MLPPSLDFRKNGAKARPPDNCTLARPNRRSLGQFGGIYRTPGTLNSGVLARVGRRIPRGRTNFLHPNFLSKAKLQSSNSRGVFPPPPSWLSIFKSLHGIFSASCFLSFPLTPSWVFFITRRPRFFARSRLIASSRLAGQFHRKAAAQSPKRKGSRGGKSQAGRARELKLHGQRAKLKI